VPAKIYDYLLSGRPILVMADNPELAGMARRYGGIHMTGIDAAGEAADRIEEEVKAGRRRHITREDTGITSEAAAGLLARVLDEASGRGPRESAG
jgi:hypothetical protein